MGLSTDPMSSATSVRAAKPTEHKVRSQHPHHKPAGVIADITTLPSTHFEEAFKTAAASEWGRGCEGDGREKLTA